MRRSAFIAALSVSLTVMLALYCTFALAAQPAGERKDQPRDGDGRMGPGRIRRSFEDPQETQKWKEELRKYRSEAEETGKKIDAVQEEMRVLFDKMRDATADDARKKVAADIQKKVKELNALELEMAQKQLEFSKESFDLALDRLVAAKVEYEETQRRIRWRNMMSSRMLDGKHGRGPGEGPPLEGPHPRRSS